MFIVLFGRIIGLKIILRLCRTFSCNILIIHYFINDQPFFFIAKPNNYTILHADSLNINDSSPLKFIEGLKFIFGIQNKIKCIFDHKSKNSKGLYASLIIFSIVKSLYKKNVEFSCNQFGFKTSIWENKFHF